MVDGLRVPSVILSNRVLLALLDGVPRHPADLAESLGLPMPVMAGQLSHLRAEHHIWTALGMVKISPRGEEQAWSVRQAWIPAPVRRSADVPRPLPTVKVAPRSWWNV